MKNQTKAVIASIVVIALALTAVSGITYSWFSDSEKANITVSTAVVDYEAIFGASETSTNMKIEKVQEGVFTISNLAANANGTITCSVTNHSTIATKYKVEVTPTSLGTGDSAFTMYDLVNVNINGTALSDINKSVDVNNGWSQVVNANDAVNAITITITTPTSYGGETPGEEVKYNSSTGEVSSSGDAIWNAQTSRSGLTLEFKIIAVQSDYTTTP